MPKIAEYRPKKKQEYVMSDNDGDNDDDNDATKAVAISDARVCIVTVI